MGDNDNSGLIIGLIIGAVIALILLSRNTQTLSTQPVQPIQQQIPNWQSMDIPRVDDIKPQQPQTQQDPKLIEMVSQLQKTSSQLEQTTHKLQELQDTVSKLRQENQPQQIIIQQPSIPQPIYQPPHVTVQPLQPISVETVQQQSTQPIQTIQPTQEQQIYKNSEKWQIVRGKDGRIKSLDIVRDVKKSN